MAGRITAKANERVHYIAQTTFTLDNQYSDLKLLGKGSYGVVVSAFSDKLQHKIAIKKITPVAKHIMDAKHVLREIRLIRHMGKHENIISMYDLCYRESYDELYIIMELMDSDLHRIIQSKQALTESHYQYFMFQLLCGLKYLHDNRIIHRDLKPGNLLVSKDCRLRITDFGLAREKPMKQTNNNNEDDDPLEESIDEPMTEHVVTRWYRPPELMLCPDGLYTYAVDIWSCGCILGEMLNRDPIFPGKNFIDQLSLVFDVIGSPKPDEVKHIVNEEARKFLKAQSVKRKVPFQKVFPQASKEACELLEAMLLFNPDSRCDVNQALFTYDYTKPYHDPKNPMFNANSLVFPPVNRSEFEFSFERNPSMTRLQLKNMINQEVVSFKREKYQGNNGHASGSAGTATGKATATATTGGAAGSRQTSTATNNAVPSTAATGGTANNTTGHGATIKKESSLKQQKEHEREKDNDNDSVSSGGSRLRRQRSDQHLNKTTTGTNASGSTLRKQSQNQVPIAGVAAASSVANNNNNEPEKHIPTYLRGTASSAYRANSAPRMRPGMTMNHPSDSQHHALPPKPKQSTTTTVDKDKEKEKVIRIDAAKVQAMMEEPDAYDVLFNGTGNNNARRASTGSTNSGTVNAKAGNSATMKPNNVPPEISNSPVRSKELRGTMDMFNKLYQQPNNSSNNLNDNSSSMRLRRSEAKEQDDAIERERERRQEERSMKELGRDFADYTTIQSNLSKGLRKSYVGGEEKERDYPRHREMLSDEDDSAAPSQPKSPSSPMRKSLRYEPSPQKSMRISCVNNASTAGTTVPSSSGGVGSLPIPSFSPAPSPKRSITAATAINAGSGSGLPQPPQSPVNNNRKSLMQTYTSPKIIASGPRASYNLDNANHNIQSGITSNVPSSPVIIVNKKFPDLPGSPNRVLLRSSNNNNNHSIGPSGGRGNNGLYAEGKEDFDMDYDHDRRKNLISSNNNIFQANNNSAINDPAILRESLSKAVHAVKHKKNEESKAVAVESDEDDEPSPVPYATQPPKPSYPYAGPSSSAIGGISSATNYSEIYANKLSSTATGTTAPQPDRSTMKPSIPPSSTLGRDTGVDRENGRRPSHGGLFHDNAKEKEKEKEKENKQKKKITVPKSPKFSTMSWQKKQEQQMQTGVGAAIEDRRKSGAGMTATTAGTGGIDKKRATSTGRMRL